MRRWVVMGAVVIGLAALGGLASLLIESGNQRRLTVQNAVITGEPSSTLVTLPGTYRYATVDRALRVWVDDGGIVQYSLKDLNGRPLAGSSERASTYSRWAFVVDGKGRLWFYSGDVGTYLWEGPQQSTTRALERDELKLSEMPEILKRYAPF